eukprot:gene11813-8124_t
MEEESSIPSLSSHPSSTHRAGMEPTWSDEENGNGPRQPTAWHPLHLYAYTVQLISISRAGTCRRSGGIV